MDFYTKSMIDQCGLKGLEKRNYEEAFIKISVMASRPELSNFQIAIKLSSVFFMICLTKGIKFKKIKTMVKNGDISSVIPGNPRDVFMSLYKASSSPDQVKDLSDQNILVKEQFDLLECSSGCWSCCANQNRIPSTIKELADIWGIIKDKDLGPPVHERACPALDSNGVCSVYEKRPEACRSYGSQSSKACQRLLFEKESITSKDNSSFVILQSMFDLSSVLPVIASVVGQQIVTIDLPTSIRSLKNGKNMDAAIEDGRVFYKNFGETIEQENMKFTPVSEMVRGQ